MRASAWLAILAFVPCSALAKTAPSSTGIDESALDRKADPCEDFYQFACGGWMKTTKIPADRPSWYRSFSEIDERNETLLRTVLDDLAAGKKVEGADAFADKLGNYYGACMDEAKADKSAPAELKALFAHVDEIKDLPSLAKVVAWMHTHVALPLFDFRSTQDFKDATQVIALADQGGLGLPDRDYYLKDDAKMKQIRANYLAHVQKMFELAGSSPSEAQKAAETVMRLEHKLAEGAMSRVDRRDPKKIYHRINLDGLQGKAPTFPWTLYLSEVGHPQVKQINVAVPEFFANLDGALKAEPLDAWKTYLRWHMLRGSAAALSKAFVDESFHFYGNQLQGTDKILPRWKRCVKATDAAMGEALARPFVAKTFGADGKSTTLAMVKQIEAAMEANLKTLSWMDDATRKAAEVKLHAIANKIGYPDRWRNYEQLTVGRDSYLQNLLAANQFEANRDLDKIGKPLDRNEWEMTPPTVNAYYEPSMNEMVFPAGILQPPFFNRAAAAPVNFGAIGMVMGHELTHGFDDEGRQFDDKGNLRDWWSALVGKDFDKRAECVVEEFNGFTAIDDLHVNGKLTLGENIADLGGIKLAHSAWKASQKPAPAKEQKGFTDEQLFFLGVGQAWCANQRPETTRMRVTVDPHSPARFRVNGPLQNLPDFAAAFQCKAGQKMVKKDACTIW